MVDKSVVGALEGVFAGALVARGDAQYETARRVWNGMVDRRPAVIARCVDESDIAVALHAAVECDLPVAVRGGGHNVAGNAVCDDGVVIDLSAWKQIDVDPVSRVARVQPGVLLGELDRATQAVGLATPTGNVSMTGLAGLTLGGGLGWIARKYGPTCDNLLSAQVVTVEGEIVTASADKNPDPLWGLRGGGGNFGVVSSFEYQLHPLGPEVLAGGILHSFADAPRVFRFLAEFVSDAPDELSVTASTFRAAPGLPVPPEMDGELVTILAVCYVGDPEAGAKALRPLRNFGRLLADLIAPMPYTALQSGSDDAYPSGQQNYWKSHYIDEITDDLIATLIEHAPRMPSPLSSFYFQHLGGAISRAGAEHAAFGHRDAAFDFAILTVWQDPTETPENVTWARDFARDATAQHRCLRQQSRHRGNGPREGGVRTGGVRTGDLRSTSRPEEPLRPMQRPPAQPEHRARFNASAAISATRLGDAESVRGSVSASLTALNEEWVALPTPSAVPWLITARADGSRRPVCNDAARREAMAALNWAVPPG